jgi:hypothetical protein
MYVSVFVYLNLCVQMYVCLCVADYVLILRVYLSLFNCVCQIVCVNVSKSVMQKFKN